MSDRRPAVEREGLAEENNVRFMKALALTATQKLEILALRRPEVRPGTVLVRVAFCGICGSDLARFFGGAVRAFPLVLGHEISGTVADVGEGVVGVSSGMKVSVAPLVPCRICALCKAGRPALCSNYSFLGSREQGGLAEYLNVPAENVAVLPDAVPLQDAALVEPLTIAIHGIDRAQVDEHDTVAVFGAGVIGLLTIFALRRRRAGRIIAVDTQPQKLELARVFGADDVVLADGDSVRSFFSTHSAPTVCIETAGSPVTRVQAVEYCARGGQVVFVGTSQHDVTFSPEVFERVLRGELRVTGSWMSYSSPFPGKEWDEAVHLVASGAFDARKLISGIYDFRDLAQPFFDLKNAHGSLLKLLYRIDGAAS